MPSGVPTDDAASPTAGDVQTKATEAGCAGSPWQEFARGGGRERAESCRALSDVVGRSRAWWTEASETIRREISSDASCDGQCG